MTQDTTKGGQNSENLESPAETETETRLWAVGFLTFGENQLIIELISAATWQDAARAHSKSIFNYEDLAPEVWSSDIETAKTFAFDCDGAFDVVEVKAGK